ncbi:hypothetical protein GO988_06530 [Hymenobacter sp. HMF4947]|uniref:Curlin-associated protein n=1 Tax=Hymenobacter ginkgonis TaxID=2682976 RepID=A0A7K1TC68_9BACT|nr:hypothetical protein [Hymenobacter ginkgonis]MVN75975.1 hypothetical protein [Hymenobacter ginkgonis]
MKRQAKWLVSSLAMGCALEAQAQSPAQPDATAQQLVESIGPDRLPAATTRNVLSLTQSGSGNAATLNQASYSLQANQAYIVQVGAANLLDLEQVGNANRANYTQTGNANQSILSQTGNANALDGSLTGNQNAVTLRQQGSSNEITSEVAASNRQYNLSQIGNNNSITQRETTPTDQRGYSIEQRGNNMHITVEQGRGLPTLP